MNEVKVIDYAISLIEAEKAKHMDANNINLLIARMRALKNVQKKLKRIEYFGGVESLIAKASITGEKERLFND